MLSPASLIPYARNPRTHTDAQIERIARSIERFGFTNPILIDRHQGIIAGHGRLRAALKLKLATVPTIELTDLSDAEKKAYIIADNKLALDAGWDNDLLMGEIADLRAADLDISLTGFTELELSVFTGDVADVSQLWQSMPSFHQDDKLGFHHLVVHFKDQAAIDDFAKMVNKPVSTATKYLWFPEIEIDRYADKRIKSSERENESQQKPGADLHSLERPSQEPSHGSISRQDGMLL
jgi:ParB-like nuclease domain